MADRYPLIVDSSTGTVKEIPSGDNLNLSGTGIVNAPSVGTTSLTATNSVLGVTTAASIKVNTIDMTPIIGVTTYYVATTGNDTTGDGSASNPWATPHRAMEYLSPKQIIDDGHSNVTVSVGVGTYNFGLKITNTGSDYITNRLIAVSGGSGSGAFVGIYTATGTNGIVTNVTLMDGGEGYVAGETLGVSTSFGTGLAFTAFHVSSSGALLGPLYVQHPQGHLVEISGAAPTGTKPGQRGNHFYNQAGVGVGSNPAGTGPNFAWSGHYDSTSPAGAYPNPMANGRGNTSASNSYNCSILESYYQTKFYCHGTDGLISLSSTPAEIDNVCFIYKNAQGFAAYNQDQGAGTNIGATNILVRTGVSTVVDASSVLDRISGGTVSLGNNVSFHNFSYGVFVKGGFVKANKTTATNTYIGYRNYGGGNFEGSYIVSTSNEFGGILNSGGQVLASAIWTANNDYHGISADGGNWGFFGGGGEEPGYGRSSLSVNNRYSGVRAQWGSVVRLAHVNGDVFVWGSEFTSQVSASNGASYIDMGNNVSFGAGIAVTSIPDRDTVAVSGPPVFID